MKAFQRGCEDLDNDITGQPLLTTIVTDEGAVYAVYSDSTLHDERAAAALQTAPVGESAVAAGSSRLRNHAAAMCKRRALSG